MTKDRLTAGTGVDPRFTGVMPFQTSMRFRNCRKRYPSATSAVAFPAGLRG
jgi:hypothetical protein